jgi:hypothetical protein
MPPGKNPSPLRLDILRQAQDRQVSHLSPKGEREAVHLVHSHRNS